MFAVLPYLQEALSALRVPLNKRRLGVVDLAFLSIASASATSASASSPPEEDGSDATTVSLVEATDRMNPEGHPEVAAGRLGQQEVRYGSVCDDVSLLAFGHQTDSWGTLVLTVANYCRRRIRQNRLWPGISYVVYSRVAAPNIS